jgi:carbon storage regulator CsrA
VLILRRKVGEKIVIGDGIVVVVTRVSGARVTLGIEAPPSVHIVRGELRPFDEAHEPLDAPTQKTTENRVDNPSVTAPIQLAPLSPLTAAAPHLPR